MQQEVHSKAAQQKLWGVQHCLQQLHTLQGRNPSGTFLALLWPDKCWLDCSPPSAFVPIPGDSEFSFFKSTQIQHGKEPCTSCRYHQTATLLTWKSPAAPSTLLPQHPTLTHLIQLSVSSSESLEMVRGRNLSRLSLTQEEARVPSASTRLAMTSAMRPEPSTTTQGILLLMATLMD